MAIVAASSLLAKADELSECRRLAPKYAAQVEVVMPDGSRCDLLTETEAIEVDWAHSKWKEAPAQAVLYAIWTGKKPAVLLLVKDAERDKADLLRCKLVCERLGIRMYVEASSPAASPAPAEPPAP